LILGQINLSRDAARLLTQLTSLFDRIDREFTRLTTRGEATWDAPNVAAGATTTTTVNVPGARVGDAVRVFAPVSLQGMVCTAYVSADDTVTLVLYNPTAGGINLASGLWRVVTERY
jgi:hypothetical protein